MENLLYRPAACVGVAQDTEQGTWMVMDVAAAHAALEAEAEGTGEGEGEVRAITADRSKAVRPEPEQHLVLAIDEF